MRCDARDVEQRAHRVGRELERAHVDAGLVGERGRDLIQPRHPAGLLLTGGASRRMRRDKATIDFGGAVDGFDAAIPYVRGREQPLAACYAPSAIAIARWLVADEADAMRDLLRLLNVNRLIDDEWDHIAPSWSLADLDTPGALLRAKRILRGPA